MIADRQGALVDLLDRALDRGLLLNADLIIHVAGVPLLGVKLRAALAGMETMLEYGMFNDWDEAIRSLESCGGTRRYHRWKSLRRSSLPRRNLTD